MRDAVPSHLLGISLLSTVSPEALLCQPGARAEVAKNPIPVPLAHQTEATSPWTSLGHEQLCAVQRSGGTVENFPGCHRRDSERVGSGWHCPGLPAPRPHAAASAHPKQRLLPPSLSEKSSDNKLAIRLCHRRAKGGRSLPPRGPHWSVHSLVHLRGLKCKTFCSEILFSFSSLSHNAEKEKN